MRVDITLAKSAPLPGGAIEALAQELGRRVNQYYPDTAIHIRYAGYSGNPVVRASRTPLNGK